MGRTRLKDDYFSWLIRLVSKRDRRYEKLGQELHKKKFRWFVHNDENRCADGLALRDRFVELEGLDESHLEVEYFLKGDCTVLEMLIGLAMRMNDLMYDLDDTQKDKTPIFFWHLLKNLTLDRFDDGHGLRGEFDPAVEAEIDEILEILMDRTYGVDGLGGLFPLKKRNRKDQSVTEIWYQMMAWLDENYGDYS